MLAIEWQPRAAGVERAEEEKNGRTRIMLGPELNYLTNEALSNSAIRNLANFKKGTTTLAFRFKGGIMVACDSRASRGSQISTQEVRKVIEINDYMLGTMAGGAADCEFWERHLGRLCRIHELKHGVRCSVSHASQMLAMIMWSYRGYGLSCGTMIAGWNTSTNESGLYMVSDSGSRIPGSVFSVGSGSTYAYGVLDTFYKWDLEIDEAHELARRAIFQAGHRDAYSGGVVRVYHIHEKGWTKLTEAADISELYKAYYHQPQN